jgi:hypothetical protein
MITATAPDAMLSMNARIAFRAHRPVFFAPIVRLISCSGRFLAAIQLHYLYTEILLQVLIERRDACRMAR